MADKGKGPEVHPEPDNNEKKPGKSRRRAAASVRRGYLLSALAVIVCVALLSWCGRQSGEQGSSGAPGGPGTAETVEPVPGGAGTSGAGASGGGTGGAGASGAAAETGRRPGEGSETETPAGGTSAAAGSSEALEPEVPPELLAAAKKEGRLTVWGSGNSDYLAAAAAYFEELYDIRVSFSRLPNSEVYTRVKSSGGNPPADVWFEAAVDPVTEAAAENLLDGDWVGMNYDPYCFLANSEVLRTNGALTPESWQDLTGEQYRMQVSMPDPNITGAGRRIVIALQQLYGKGPDEKEKGLDLLRALHRNIDNYGTRTAEPAEQAALGSCGVAVCLFSDAVTQLRNGNEMLIPVFPEEGMPYERNAAAVLRGADHPEAAKLFLLFVQTAECQDLAARCGAYQIPEAEGALMLPEIKEFSLNPGSTMEFDFESAKENGSQYINDFYAALIR